MKLIFLITGKIGTKLVNCSKYSVCQLDLIYRFYDNHKDFKIVTIEKK